MAGIEKVCEYSGIYPGPKMYDYKRDHIQILPEYRMEFKYKEHTLFMFAPDYIDPTFHIRDGRVVDLFSYCLHVHQVSGRVNGYYWNSSPKINNVRRKLKRMLCCQKLNEVLLPFSERTMWQYCTANLMSTELFLSEFKAGTLTAHNVLADNAVGDAVVACSSYKS